MQPTSIHEPIAVIGIGCRFPGGVTDAESYWSFLAQGGNAIVDIPSDRWNWQRFYADDPQKAGKMYTHRGGFLQEPFGYFDADFFGITPREASALDPQQRLLLEVTWEAIENAGLVLDKIKGSRTGVYIGAFTMDNLAQQLGVSNRMGINSHTPVAATMTMLSNRLSYMFDLRGPSISIDTACSSSLVTLHLACQAIWHGECEQAISGGVNVMFRPEMVIAMSKGHFLSPDGLCKAFDESANGYVRGEGAGVVILKPLSHAERDGDPIHALIYATGVNQDGRTSSITLPNSDAQRQLILEVCEQAGIQPGQMDYVEAHGTGTQAGDIAEANSLGSVLGVGRDEGEKCWIGSVKTNIGHLEAAAGVASLIKVIQALKYQTLPPHLHLKKPNPNIDFEALRLQIPTELRQHPMDYVGINSFGYGGTNAHVIVRRYQQPLTPILTPPPLSNVQAIREGSLVGVDYNPPVGEHTTYLLPFSARSKEALQAKLTQHADFLTQNPDVALADYGYSLARRQNHHSHRLAMVATSRPDTITQLREMSGIQTIPVSENKLVFVFTGMGPQWWGMGAELMEREPVFRATIEACDGIFRQYSDLALVDWFRNGNGQPMGEPLYAQPANFALQAALFETWRHYGVTPDAMVGHSVGEIAAAYAAATLTLEQAIKITYHRSHLMQTTWGQGKMLAVGLGYDAITPILTEYEDTLISIAAINSPSSVTLAGSPLALQALSEHLTAQGIFNAFLKVEVAYHSTQMEPLESEFKARIGTIEASTPQIPLYSTVTGQLVSAGEQDTEYWWRNARQPVRLMDTLNTLIEDGYRLFLEVGPHPVLSSAIQECLLGQQTSGYSVPSMRRQEPEILTLRQAQAKLFNYGYALDWSAEYPQGRHVILPTYPWQKAYFWDETEPSRAERLDGLYHPILQTRQLTPLPTWDGELSDLTYLGDHRINATPIFAAAGYVEALFATTSDALTVEKVVFKTALLLDTPQVLRLQIDDGQAHIYSRPSHRHSEWMFNAGATLLQKPLPLRQTPLDLADLQTRFAETLHHEDLYGFLAENGYYYRGVFQSIQQIWYSDSEALAQVRLPDEVDTAGYYAHPALLDGCFQAMVMFVQRPDTLYLPVAIEQIRRHAALPREVWCHLHLTLQNAAILESDLTITDAEGQVLMEIIGLRLQAVSSGVTQNPQWRYELTWQDALALDVVPPSHDVQVIFGDANGIAAQLLDTFPRQNWLCIEAGEHFAQHTPNHWVINPATDFPRLLAELPVAEIGGWVYLWQLDPLGYGDGQALLDFIKALDAVHGEDQPSRLYIVTHDLYHNTARPGQMLTWGMGRVIVNEHPWLKTKMIDWDGADITALARELQHMDSELEVMLVGEQRRVHRLIPTHETNPETQPTSADVPFVLAVEQRGSFDHLAYHEASRRAPGRGEIEVRIQATGLNFKDLMKVLDLLPATYLENTFFQNTLGLEAGGVVVAVGEDVSDFTVGDEVLIFAPQGNFRSHATVSAQYVFHKPAPLKLTQSISLINFITAYYALKNVASLQAGEKVLIHSATGGVGLAAIQIARWLGAEIYATAGSADKRNLLHEMGIEYVSDSRSLGFADDILAWTDGRGMDVVLNSLSGEALAKSVQILAPYGRLVDIGKRDITENKRLALGDFDRNLTFSAIDLDRMLIDRWGIIQQATHAILDLLAQGILQPLPVTVFTADQVGDAFRLMGQSKHIGKIVVTMDTPTHIQPQPAAVIQPTGTYLVTGGLNGLGLETALWLGEMGASSLVLVGRSGASSEVARQAVAQLTASGVKVRVVAADVANRTQMAELITSIEDLRGVIHSAMVLDDDVMLNLDAERFEKVIAPKARGAWLLHELTQHLVLDFFVLYSSVSSYIGNPRQANYVAANSFLDGLAHYRRNCGLPAISINWGSIAKVGAVARNPKVKQYLGQLGLRGLDPQRAMGVLAEVLAENPVQATIMDIDWQKWATNPLGLTQSSLFQTMTSIYANRAAHQPALIVELMQAPPQEVEALVFQFLCAKISRITHIPVDRLDTQKRLEHLGFDSLMGIELNNLIKLETGVEFSVMTLMRGLSVDDMAGHLMEKLRATYPELEGEGTPS